MASLKALCLTGVASLSVATAAHAADMPSTVLPPVPVYAPPPAPVGVSGFYLRGDVGVGIADLRTRGSTFDAGYDVPDLRYETHSLDDAAFVDAGVGYRFNNYIRADVTGEYRAASHFSATESYTAAPGTGTASTAYDKDDASIRSVVGLVNGYVDAGTWYGLTPFVGAGVGVANVSVKNLTDISFGNAYGYGNGGGGYAGDHSTTKFAYALMAGLDFHVTPNLTLEFGYRFLDLGTVSSGTIGCAGTQYCGHEVQHYRLSYNDIRLGARYMFTDVLPRAPVIARY